MDANLGATAERKVYEVDAVGVNNSECLGTGLGIRTRLGGVVTKLEDVAGLSKRRLLKIYSIPFLGLVERQNYAKVSVQRGRTHFNDVEAVE